MGNLASTYSDLGRHDDALAMQERVLEFSRRVLPENHPDIGEGDVLVWDLHDCDCDALLFCLMCRRGHGQSCLNVLCAWKARRCACDEGKGAGVQASGSAGEPSFNW